MADSGVVGLMGQPTGDVGVVTSRLTVGLEGRPVGRQSGGGDDQAANRVCWSGDQSADSGVGVMTSQPTVGWCRRVAV